MIAPRKKLDEKIEKMVKENPHFWLGRLSMAIRLAIIDIENGETEWAVHNLSGVIAEYAEAQKSLYPEVGE